MGWGLAYRPSARPTGLTGPLGPPPDVTRRGWRARAFYVALALAAVAAITMIVIAALAVRGAGLT